MKKYYTLSKSFSIKIGANGELTTKTLSVTHQNICNLAIEDLIILQCFANKVTLQEGYDLAKKKLSISYATFNNKVKNFIKDNIITTLSNNFSPGYVGFAKILSHHSMLFDENRVNAYRNAISNHVKDKVVVEIGCGTGILSIFACQAGAKKVYAIEESAIATLANQMFIKNKVNDKVSLLIGNSMDIDLPEKVDVIIHEIIGGLDPLCENILPYIADAKKRFLKRGGVLLPNKIDVCCVGIEAEYIPSLTTRFSLEAKEFSSIYNINFDPYIKMLQGSNLQDDLITVPRKINPAFDGRLNQIVLSDECLLYSFDLNAKDDVVNDFSPVKMHINTTGRLGSLVLYFRAHFGERQQLTTSPYAPRCYSWRVIIRDLPSIINVSSGDYIKLQPELSEFDGVPIMRINPC